MVAAWALARAARAETMKARVKSMVSVVDRCGKCGVGLRCLFGRCAMCLRERTVETVGQDKLLMWKIIVLEELK